MPDADEQKVIDDITAHGWHCVQVLEDEQGPGFAYSVGLDDTFRTPELIVFGLKPDLMHAMLWELARQIQAGRVVAEDAVFYDLIEGFPCVLKPVHPERLKEFFGYALWYYRYQDKLERLHAFQIFWPGKLDSFFPWQDGCAEAVKDAQPLLYQPRIDGRAS